MEIVTLLASWVIARLKEPSTWAGIGVFVTAHLYNLSWLASPDVVQYGCMFVAAILAVVLKEAPGWFAPKAPTSAPPPSPNKLSAHYLATVTAILVTALMLAACAKQTATSPPPTPTVGAVLSTGCALAPVAGTLADAIEDAVGAKALNKPTNKATGIANKTCADATAVLGN